MPTIGQRVRHIVGDAFGAAIVEQTIEKAVADARDRASEPETTFYDPMSLFMGREWLIKQGQPLQPADLRAMSSNPIIGSIIGTRLSQIAAFCTPQSSDYELGFKIISDATSGKKDTPAQRDMQTFIYNMGIPGYGEPLLETFARKFMRDSLVLDQACAEIVMRRNYTPAYVVAVDSATIKRLPASLRYAIPSNRKDSWYCQIMNDTIVAEYSADEMIFGVRNPKTDIEALGYGTSELEILLRTITTMLNSDRFNSGQLTQGGTAKGVLIVKGDSIDNDQFNIFKRDFREAIRNASTYWRPPVLRVSKGSEVDWKELDRSNRDMEYSQLFEYLVKQACGVYQIDPTEINWQIGASGVTTSFDSSGPQKQQVSRQRGLKPLLTFLSNQLNISVIQKINPELRLEFKGFDQDRATDAEITSKEVTTIKTVNEARAERGWKKLPGHDVILSQILQMATAPAADLAKPVEDKTDAKEVDANTED